MELGHLIESEIRAMQNRPVRIMPQQQPEAPLGAVLERMINSALPQTIRDFQTRQKILAQAKKHQEGEERRTAALSGFDGEFVYEKGDPNF